MVANDIKEKELRAAKRYFENGELLLSPPLKRAAYSDRMAWILASMAQLAYDQFEDGGDAREIFIAKLKGGGFELLDEFHDKDIGVQAFLAANIRNKYVVLAFRGTEVTERADIKADIMVRKISAKTVQGAMLRIHTGFNNAYLQIHADIEKSLLAKLDDRPLYITGHSLGGALATVATKLLENKKIFRDQIAACYTFGSPRVGNKVFVRDFKCPIYRVVNTTDIVTIMPTLGYYHVGDVRFLLRKLGEVMGSIPVADRTVFFLRAIFLNLFTPLVGDHGIQQYREKLEEIARIRNALDKRMGHG